jgi:capsule polysaccharide export protein KpsE/RkpR
MPSMIDTGSYSAQIVDLENQNRQLVLQSKKPPARDEALATAEAQLSALQAIYADSHPDVVTAKERLKALRQAVGAAPDVDSSV